MHCLDWWTIFNDPGHMRSLKAHPKNIAEERKKGSTNPVKDKHFLVESEDFNVKKKHIHFESPSPSQEVFFCLKLQPC